MFASEAEIDKQERLHQGESSTSILGKNGGEFHTATTDYRLNKNHIDDGTYVLTSKTNSRYVSLWECEHVQYISKL